jgi:hypothetical protein
MTIKDSISIQELKAKAAAKVIRYSGYTAKAVNINGAFVVTVKATFDELAAIKKHIDAIFKYDINIQSL